MPGPLDLIADGRLAEAKIAIAGLLRAYPGKSYYHALNCTLLDAANDPKCLAECDALAKKTPSDRQALELLAKIYEKHGRLADAIAVYERAVKKYPTPELAHTWFQRTLREHDYKTAQRAAMLVARIQPLRAASGSAAFCNYIYAKNAGDEKVTKLHAALARSLLEKLAPETSDEHQLYVYVLQLQNDYERIVSHLEGVERLLPLTIAFLEALDKREEWERLFTECGTLLFEKKFNDYSTCKYYIKAAHHLKKPAEEIRARFDDSRNGCLSRILLNKVYKLDLDEPVRAYLSRFGTKPCAAEDLQAFDLPETLYTLPEADDLQRIVQSLPGDKRHQIRSIVQLEHLAQQDPDDFRPRLWLLNLYTAIGCPLAALETYRGLKIKMVQHDSLFHKLALNPGADSLKELVNVYRFYVNADSDAEQYVERGFERGRYGQLEDFLAFGKRLANSVTRHLVVIQALRFSRMANNGYREYFESLLKDKKSRLFDLELCDNRDFKTDYAMVPCLEGPERPAVDPRYITLLYLKEMLISEKSKTEAEELSKRFDTSIPLEPIDRVFLNLWRLYFVGDRALVDAMSWETIKEQLSNEIEPLTRTLNEVLVNVDDLVSVLKLSKDPKIASAAKRLQAAVTQHKAPAVVVEAFKEATRTLNTGLDAKFVSRELGILEDNLRKSTHRI